jgi:hypothetical protein
MTYNFLKFQIPLLVLKSDYAYFYQFAMEDDKLKCDSTNSDGTLFPAGCRGSYPSFFCFLAL